jgi:hypothetical protein
MARGVGFNRNLGMRLLGVSLPRARTSGFAALGVPSVLMAVPALIASILIVAGR